VESKTLLVNPFAWQQSQQTDSLAAVVQSIFVGHNISKQVFQSHSYLHHQSPLYLPSPYLLRYLPLQDIVKNPCFPILYKPRLHCYSLLPMLT